MGHPGPGASTTLKVALRKALRSETAMNLKWSNGFGALPDSRGARREQSSARLAWYTPLK